ncbi:MAG: 2-amino-4-hydroxy-6-hydroxymethyldihydropteridine diphosphokinase [Bacteroidales bacterium]|nr:2-amino-4-hydroxy-6-hydroxymethyldihydropteridine diphosphokinase [Bacteroidales bacterium]
MALIVLLLGSNVPDKNVKLKKAEEALAERLGPSISRSELYETEPWGFKASETFLNRVLAIESALLPEEILEVCLNIEKSLGRIRKKPGYETREIDIDILLYGDLILETRDLILPHPRLHLRRFVLEPLNELVPELVHPLLKKSISALLSECRDTCWVRKL